MWCPLVAVAFLVMRQRDTQLCMVAMGFLAPTAGFLLLNYPRGSKCSLAMAGRISWELWLPLCDYPADPQSGSVILASLLIVSYPIYETIRPM